MGKGGHIVFDCYQTLLDTDVDPTRRDVNVRNGWEAFVSSLSDRYGVSVGARRFEVMVEQGKESFYSTHDRATRHHDLVSIVSEILQRECGMKIADDAVRELLYEYRKASRGHVRPYAGVREVLGELSMRYDISVASYAQSASTYPELVEVGLDGYFSNHVFSSDIGFRKTSPEFNRECLRIVGAEPEECIMVGDNYHDDIVVPAELGFRTVWVRNSVTAPDGLVPDRANASIDIADFCRLPAVLKGAVSVSG